MAKLGPAAVWALVREVRASSETDQPLQVSGVLAAQLVRELARGGDAGWVREGGDPDTAVALVHVLGGAVTPEDERALRAAHRARTPIVAVQTGTELDHVPYVLATDVVPCPPGEGFPVEAIAARVAGRLGASGVGLAAHLPVMRTAVVEQLIESASRRNGVIGAAVWIPGADFPVLTLNQLRLVLRLAAAHGVPIEASRAPELAAVLASAFGFRAAARQLLAAVPVGGWALKGGMAYAGTRAVGEAAARYFAARAA